MTIGMVRRCPMTDTDRENLKRLADLLRAEQTALLVAASRLRIMPGNGTLERVAQLELNIAAIENTLSD